MKPLAAILLSASALVARDTVRPLPKAPAGMPTGTYVLNNSPDLPRGIALAAEGVPFLLRGLAEKRLADLNPAYRRLRLSQDGSSITVQFDGRQPMRMPLKGGTAWTREDGETFWVSATAEPSRLVQTYKARDGERTNEFILAPDGKVLILKVSVRSPRLSHVLNYSMVYTPVQ